MTDDLVTRLRAHEEPITSRDGVVTYEGVKVCQEAADRIEQDAATIARLEGERDEMEAEAHAHIEMWGKALREKAAAEAKVAALVEALESIERETQNVTPELMNQQMALHSAASVARALLDQFK